MLSQVLGVLIMGQSMKASSVIIFCICGRVRGLNQDSVEFVWLGCDDAPQFDGAVLASACEHCFVLVDTERRNLVRMTGLDAL